MCFIEDLRLAPSAVHLLLKQAAGVTYATRKSPPLSGSIHGLWPTAAVRTRAHGSGRASHSNTRIDHAPDCLPALQLPLTTVCTASLNRSAKPASGSRSTPAFHVPEYSVLLPETAPRHVPVHPVRDFAADHPPRVTALPFASTSVHVRSGHRHFFRSSSKTGTSMCSMRSSKRRCSSFLNLS